MRGLIKGFASIKSIKNNGVEHRSLEERATEFDGQLNLDGEFDWPPTVGRKRWDEYDNEAPTQLNK